MQLQAVLEMVRPVEAGMHVRVTALTPVKDAATPLLPGSDWSTYWNQMEYISRCLSGGPITDQVTAYSPFENHSFAGEPERASESGGGRVKSIFDGVGSNDAQEEDAPKKQTAATAHTSVASIIPPRASKKQDPDPAKTRRKKGFFELALLDQFAREDAEWSYEKPKKDKKKASGSGCGTGAGLDDW
jgi:hypothetical protein